MPRVTGQARAAGREVPGSTGAASLNCQYFSSLTHQTQKQPHPLAVNAAMHFSPLGYHSEEEIPAWEESFGQVQREGLGEWKVL